MAKSNVDFDDREIVGDQEILTEEESEKALCVARS
jgi:hypothetical protein